MWLHFSFWHAEILGFNSQHPIKIKVGKVVIKMVKHKLNRADCFVDLPVTCPCFCFLGKALHVRACTEGEGSLSRCFSPLLFHSASLMALELQGRWMPRSSPDLQVACAVCQKRIEPWEMFSCFQRKPIGGC